MEKKENLEISLCPFFGMCAALSDLFSFKSLKSSLVRRRSLLTRCPREVWERAGEYLSVTSQLTVESRIDRAENA